VLPESRTTQRVRSQRQIQCSQQKLAGCRTKPAGEIHTAAHDGPRPLPTSAFVPVPARRRTEGRARARSDTVHGGAAVRTGWCCRARAASLRRAMRRRSTSIQSRYRGTCLHYPILSVSVWVADHRSTKTVSYRKEANTRPIPGFELRKSKRSRTQSLRSPTTRTQKQSRRIALLAAPRGCSLPYVAGELHPLRGRRAPSPARCGGRRSAAVAAAARTTRRPTSPPPGASPT
jgi:hypothetical protein